VTETRKGVTLDGLLSRFRSMSGLEARFVEQKHMSLLVEPLVTEGALYFAPPDQLVRRTTKPSVTTMVINGSRLSFTNGHSSDSLSLDTNPVARLFVESFLQILRGDSGALQKTFGVQLAPGGGESWSMQLKPRIAPMSDVIASLELTGDGVVLKTMRIVETGGDDTVTTFSDVNVRRQFSTTERAGLFAAMAP
jgi:hypothetical protein